MVTVSDKRKEQEVRNMESFKTDQEELEALRRFVRSVAALDLDDDDLTNDGEHDLFCTVQADAQALARRKKGS